MTIWCIWAWRDSGRRHESGYKKRMKKRKTVLSWCSISTDKKLATTQGRQILQNSDEKQDWQYWILRLVVFNRFLADRDGLLKLYTLVKSARTVSRELLWDKRVYIGLTS